MALHAPRNERELQRVKNLNLKSRDMGELLEAVEAAKRLPERSGIARQGNRRGG